MEHIKQTVAARCILFICICFSLFSSVMVAEEVKTESPAAHEETLAFVLQWLEEKKDIVNMFYEEPKDSHMSRAEALALGMEEILAIQQDFVLSDFAQHSPFAFFDPDQKEWILSILPSEIPAWGFFITVHDATGTILSFREVEPVFPSEDALSNIPKG